MALKYGRPVKCPNIIIEEGVIISRTARIDTSRKSTMIIRKNAVISHNTVIMNHTHKLTVPTIDKTEYPSTLEIGESAFILWGAIILPQVTRIGKNSIVGAGSVVTKNVGDNEIWAGNPAKKIGIRTNDTQVEE